MRLACVLGLALCSSVVGCAPRVIYTTVPAPAAPAKAESPCQSAGLLAASPGRQLDPAPAAKPEVEPVVRSAAGPTQPAEPASERARDDKKSSKDAIVGKLTAPTGFRSMRIDVFAFSDVTPSRLEIDGFPAGGTPVRTFILSEGDHVFTLSAPGFKSCEFTMRDLREGQSVTFRGSFADKDGDCGRARVLDQAGKIASF